MKNLKDILYGVSVFSVQGNMGLRIKNIQFDSRKVKSNDVYVAQKGNQVDGHSYIQAAVEKGAIAVICEQLPPEINPAVTYVQCSDSKKALGIMASNFYDNPSTNLKVVGVTGTNGKTSVTTLLHQLFSALGYSCGLLSTIQVKIGDKVIHATHTTPNAIAIQESMAMMVEDGCEYCFMEVSSHGIHQERIAGIQFVGGGFTNITHDHLDYHSTFKEYIEVKKAFFDQLGKKAFAISNRDDKNGQVMLQNTVAKKSFYALKTDAEYQTRLIENSFDGMHLSINGSEVYFPLVGLFNAYNLTLVYAIATELGQDKQEVLQYLSTLKGAEGRFAHIKSKEGVSAIVDYAHTPDALENVLKTIFEIKADGARIITVVGCGGDRDKAKRPKMAKIAALFSNHIILTSDNPRSEDPLEILKDMEKGVEATDAVQLTIVDRQQAIKTAVALAKPKDIILIAGKGHENYQEIKGERFPFDDMKEVKTFLKIQE